MKYRIIKNVNDNYEIQIMKVDFYGCNWNIVASFPSMKRCEDFMEDIATGKRLSDGTMVVKEYEL